MTEKFSLSMLLLACFTFMQLSFAHSATAADSEHTAKLDSLNHTGLQAYRNHDYATAETTFKTALDEAYAANDQAWVGTFLANLSAVYSAQGKLAHADRLSLEAQAIKDKMAGITMRPPIVKRAASSRPGEFQLKSLSGYISESQRLDAATSKHSVLARTLTLQPQSGIFDSSIQASSRPRIGGSASNSSRTASGGIEWGPWPTAKLPPSEPFQPLPPEGVPRHQFGGPPPGACVPCHERNGVMVLIRVQGFGAFFGPPGPPPRSPGGLFNLFDYSESFSSGEY